MTEQIIMDMFFIHIAKIKAETVAWISEHKEILTNFGREQWLSEFRKRHVSPNLQNLIHYLIQSILEDLEE